MPPISSLHVAVVAVVVLDHRLAEPGVVLSLRGHPGLLVPQRRVLLGHLGQPLEDEPELDRHRLLTPQRAVVVEHGDPLLLRESLAAPTKSSIACRDAVGFQDGSGSGFVICSPSGRGGGGGLIERRVHMHLLCDAAALEELAYRLSDGGQPQLDRLGARAASASSPSMSSVSRSRSLWSSSSTTRAAGRSARDELEQPVLDARTRSRRRAARPRGGHEHAGGRGPVRVAVARAPRRPVSGSRASVADLRAALSRWISRISDRPAVTSRPGQHARSTSTPRGRPGRARSRCGRSRREAAQLVRRCRSRPSPRSRSPRAWPGAGAGTGAPGTRR